MILTNIFLIFQRAKSELEPISVEVKAHDPSWIKEQNMGSFLSVSHGSAENPVFLEMSYNNTGAENSDSPIVLVGKGVTFDTGGISIKPSAKMDQMRGDMGGAACMTGCLYTVAQWEIFNKLVFFSTVVCKKVYKIGL